MMKGRRDFLKLAAAAGGAAAVAGPSKLLAATAFPAGLVYTQDAPGRWKGREGAHVPKITVSGGTVKIVNTHPITPNHFIVKHTLLTPDGKVLGEKTLTNTDTPESTFTLPDGFKGTLWATSFCNLHDLWLAELTV
jgi:superoxide reductase